MTTSCSISASRQLWWYSISWVRHGRFIRFDQRVCKRVHAVRHQWHQRWREEQMFSVGEAVRGDTIPPAHQGCDQLGLHPLFINKWHMECAQPLRGESRSPVMLAYHHLFTTCGQLCCDLLQASKIQRQALSLPRDPHNHPTQKRGLTSTSIGRPTSRG